jgi:hypothetical protein
VGWIEKDAGNKKWESTTVPTKTTTLTGIWADAPPSQGEYITVNSQSGVPIYRFKLTDAWRDTAKGVSKVTYKIWVEQGAADAANRMFVLINLSPNASGVVAMQSGWGEAHRVMTVADYSDVNTILGMGKNKDSEPGKVGEWVTYECEIGPTLADVKSPGSNYVSDNYPSTAAGASIFIGVGLTSNSGNVSYFIKDVKLMTVNGTPIDHDSLDTTVGSGASAPKLGAFYFTALAANRVVRTMKDLPYGSY